MTEPRDLYRISSLAAFTCTLLLLLLLTSPAEAQYDQVFFKEVQSLAEADSNQLTIEFRSLNFLRNNEYVNPIYKGYTLIGLHAEPRLSWQAGGETKISGGIYLLRYDGDDKNGFCRPVFTVQQKLGKKTELLFGTINRSGGHGIPHPVYSLEQNLNGMPEEGLQFFFHGNMIQAESWISWEQFLLWGENKQEKLSGGFSFVIQLSKPDNAWYARMPGYLLACHRGGQIDVSTDNMQTLLNSGLSPVAGVRFKSRWIREAGLQFGVHQFSDGSPNKQLATTKGYALYPACILNGKFWRLESGFWRGHSFYALKGDPIFSNIAFTDGSFLKDRKMFVTQLQLSKETKYGIRMGLQAELNYDTDFGETDYSYSFYLRFSDQWLLWKKKAIF